MKKVSIMLIILLSATASLGQKKIDLEDLQIKGELHSDNRMRILARDKNKIKNYVKFRTHFRKEIAEGLPRPQPKQLYYSKFRK